MTETIAYTDYTPEQIRDTIEKAVAADGTRRQPRFYVITGSHVYGFPSESSDVDVRGFHTVEAERYAYLNTPKKEVNINMDGVTQGFEDVADIELRSSELRQFGHLLSTANYNIMEVVFEAEQVMNGLVLDIDALRALIKEYLPLNVPHSYVGMARSNYYNYLDPHKEEAYRPSPKKFLYVYRGLLGARYVHENHDIEANVRTLAEEVELGDPDLIDRLIHQKQNVDEEECSDELEEDVRGAITEAMNDLPDFDSVEKAEYRDDLDQWMRKVRHA